MAQNLPKKTRQQLEWAKNEAKEAMVRISPHIKDDQIRLAYQGLERAIGWIEFALGERKQ